MKEEIKYGIVEKGLPIIVVYPEYKKISDIVGKNGEFKKHIIDLWNNIPCFRDYMKYVATLHIPCDKEAIRIALEDKDFMTNTMSEAGNYYYVL